MKRNILDYKVKKVFPRFFWCKCSICRVEFKKEYGWRLEFPTTYKYICTDCAKDEKELKEVALTWGKSGCNKPTVKLK